MSSSPTAEVIRLGAEAMPLRLLDDAHDAPATLVAAALATPFARRDKDLYPGVRGGVPTDYAGWLATTVTRMIGAGVTATVRDTSFASVTDDPAALAPIQRVPHFDTTDSDVYATVHYLCHPPHRGTAFYRHERTGLQRIDAARGARWTAELARDAQRHGLPGPGYVQGSTPTFTQIHAVDLRFNRLILYPANCLHSGIVDDHRFAHAPATGRLTITSLIHLTPSI